MLFKLKYSLYSLYYYLTLKLGYLFGLQNKESFKRKVEFIPVLVSSKLLPIHFNVIEKPKKFVDIECEEESLDIEDENCITTTISEAHNKPYSVIVTIESNSNRPGDLKVYRLDNSLIRKDIKDAVDCAWAELQKTHDYLKSYSVSNATKNKNNTLYLSIKEA